MSGPVAGPVAGQDVRPFCGRAAASLRGSYSGIWSASGAWSIWRSRGRTETVERLWLHPPKPARNPRRWRQEAFARTVLPAALLSSGSRCLAKRGLGPA
jgi:hypothetical protein